MGRVSDRIWSDILGTLRHQQPALYRPWFNTLQPAGIDNGVIELGTATADQHLYLQQHCRTALGEAARSVTGRLVTFTLLPPPAAPEPRLTFEEDTEHLVLDPDYTFDGFVTGPCNRLAHAACQAAADRPGQVYNPLFIHGDVGLGKTHLLQAACHHIRSRQPDARILYISCETFTNHFVEAIERGAMHQFRYRYRHVDALVIDDIQFLAARERSREEFFHTFNTLFQSRKQIVLSADESPRDIPSLEDRLISRFSWGLVARIELPCLETRMAILQKKAKLRCADIPEDVLHYVAASVESNTRELEGALTRILAIAEQYGGRVDLEIARQATGMNGRTPKRAISISAILDLVTHRYNVRLADLQGKRRNRSLAFPRQVCMYLARDLTRLSLGEIGGHFGGRDHTTVLHAVRTIQAHRERDSQLETDLIEMTEMLRRSAAN
jgi:chromosomal replication initiator protein